MRRPLAVFGFSWLLWMLLAARFLNSGWLLPFAALAATAFLLLFLCHRRGLLGRGVRPILLVLAAGALALVWRVGYDAVRLAPLLQLDGAERMATAYVVDLVPGPAAELETATLRVHRLDGERIDGLQVEVTTGEGLSLGDELRVPLRFSARAGTGSTRYYAKNQPLRAYLLGQPEVAGKGGGLSVLLRKWQYTLGNSIVKKLPREYAAVAAAMAVGDTRYLSYETTAAYRAAGVSHLLVVSGMHLAILCGMAYALASRWLRKRQASVVCIAFVLFFMGFNGFTPSVVRSGVVFLFLYVGNLAVRQSDSLTALGAVALGICLVNPWAAADTGFLFSLTATLGVMAGSKLAKPLCVWLARRIGKPNPRVLRRYGLRTLQAAAKSVIQSLCVTAATLPVVVLAGYGVSLFTLPMNLLAVPLLTPLVLGGLFMAIPAGWPVVGWLATGVAVAEGVVLRALNWLTGLCAALPWALVPLSGAFLLAAVLACLGLVAVGMLTLSANDSKGRRKAALWLVAAALLLPFSALTHVTLRRGTVSITLAGSGPYASAVVARDGEAVILYRGSRSDAAVQKALTAENVRKVALLVDMRQSGQSTSYENRFSPAEVITFDDIVSRRFLSPFGESGPQLYLKKQADGRLACLDVAGCKVGVAAGRLDLSAFPPLDILLPGGGDVAGQYRQVVTSGSPPDWLPQTAFLRMADSGMQMLLRPGKSLVFREEWSM